MTAPTERAEAIARRRRLLEPAEPALARAEASLDRAAELTGHPSPRNPAPASGLADYRAQLSPLVELADSFRTNPAALARQTHDLDTQAGRLSDAADQVERASVDLEQAWQSYELEERISILADLTDVLRNSARIASALSAIVVKADVVVRATRLRLEEMIAATQADLDRDALASQGSASNPSTDLLRALDRIMATSQDMTELADAVTDRLQEAGEAIAEVTSALADSRMARVRV